MKRVFTYIVLFLLLSAGFLRGQDDAYYTSPVIINPSSAIFITDLKTRIRTPYTRVSYDNYDETNIANFASYLISSPTRGVLCVYSGYEYTYTPLFTWAVFSREHTWCQSWMPDGGEGTDQYSDQHHLFPTHKNNANNRRSNHPLGIVTHVTYQFYDGKLGTNASGIVYEPRNSQKGDAARALFYMCVRYDVIGYTWNFNSLNALLPTLSVPEAPQDLATLLAWHQQDPPDKWEVSRNNYVWSLQENRNPFVDHPEYVNYINFNDLTKLNPSYSTEPENYAANFTAAATGNSITVNWTSAVAGTQAPSGYILEAFNKDDYFIPIDGVVFTNDVTLDSIAHVNIDYPLTSYTFDNLSNSTYYFRLYSYNGDASLRNYKTTGTVPSANATIGGALAAEPTNYVTDFAASSVTASSISLGWTDALPGTQAPSGYLILANNTNSFTAPSPGISYSDDLNLSDGSAVANVNTGVNTLSFSSLPAGTTYYFKIYSYNGTGTSRNYKTDGTVPSVTAATGLSGTIVGWNFDGQTTTATSGLVGNLSQQITTTPIGTLSYPAGAGSSGFAISKTGWDAGSGTKYWQVNFSTSGYMTLVLSSKQNSSNTGPKDFKVQYKISAGGTWTDVTGATITVANDNFGSGVLADVSLPTSCDNQPDVYLRWIMTSNNAVSGSLASGGTSRIDDILIVFQAPAPVTLSSFTSSVFGNNVRLNWVTSEEINNDKFEVYRNNVLIGNVKGNGNVYTPTRYSFEDRNLQSGKYNYRLKQIDYNGNFEYFNLNSVVEIGVPSKFDLSQNYPNPFNPSTKINFNLPADCKVSLIIYDVTGREAAKILNNEFRTAGYYTAEFNASNFASGVYFYSLSAGNFRITKRALLVK